MKNQIKLNELANSRFQIEIGSSVISKSSEWTNQELVSHIEEAICHNLFDWDFYYNWTDCKQEYMEIFNDYKDKNLLNNINQVLSSMFSLDSDKCVLRFNMNSVEAKNWIDKWFISNRSASSSLKGDYYQYRLKYNSINLID